MFIVTVLWVTVKRIIHNWRISLGLLIGLVLAAGIMSAIPIYTGGSLHRSFIQQWAERGGGRPPFAIITTHSNERYRYIVDYELLDSTRRQVDSQVRRAAGHDPVLTSEFVNLGTNAVLPVEDRDRTLASPTGQLVSLDNLRDVGEIVTGRWYEERPDDVVEIVVDERTFNQSELSIGDRMNFWYPKLSGVSWVAEYEDHFLVEMEVVGVFRAKEGTSTAEWIYPPPFFDRMFAHEDELFEYLVREHGFRPRTVDTLWVFDFQDVYVNELPGLISRFESIQRRGQDAVPEIRLWNHPLEFFQEFEEMRAEMSLFLVTLSVPTIGMVLYYIALMAGISVDHRKKEIAVLRSRGSGKAQILLSFLLEWMVMAAFAVAIGPYVGSIIARGIGISSGFLEFVGRAGVPAVIESRAYMYSAIAGAMAVAAGMIPVFGALRHSVVTYVQSRDRRPKVSIWHRYFIDVILLVLAVFGYSRLQWESAAVVAEGEIPADPLLFFVPVLFVVGAGLLVLRLYPLVMNLLRYVTTKLPGVVSQMAFRRMSRNASEYVPVMLLLIVTVSLGVYSAVTARTLRLNFEDTIRYYVGADLATEEEWHPPTDNGFDTERPVTSEPPFYQREQLSGVKAAARVLRGGARVSPETGQHGLGVEMMAIEPYEFARTAWFRGDLMMAHPFEYLELMTRHREGVIVDTESFNENSLSLGDRVIVQYNGQEVPAYVAGHVDYWPTLNPYESSFAIMNLLHVQDYTELEPYDVWYRMSDSGKALDLVDELTDLGVYVTRMTNTEAELLEMRREPYRMGFFGMLSMGFLGGLIVTALGFFVFTVFSIRSRLVQFGALRAMGFSATRLISVIGAELVFTVGVALAIGVAVGTGVSRGFVPFIRDRAADLEAAPPFVVVARSADIYTILGVLGAVFLVAVVALTVIIASLRVTRAIKLGEEG